MNAHADHPPAKPLGRFAAWLNAKRRARRAYRLEEETVACLGAMDTRLLNDIGMDIGKLGELATGTPDVTATDAPEASQHSNRSKSS